MLEPLKNFLIDIDFSLKEIPNQDEKIDEIYKSYFQKSKFTQQEIQNCFIESYRLVKKHIDSLQFEQDFKKDFDDALMKINISLADKELTYILLTQIYQSNIQKIQLQKLIDRYENIELEHYCLKQEYLTSLATKFGSNKKLSCILEKQMDQLKEFQMQENKFLNEMKEMKLYFESKVIYHLVNQIIYLFIYLLIVQYSEKCKNELKFKKKEFVQKQFELFNINSISKVERSTNPVLPNFFINLKIADSLSELSKSQFSKEFINQANHKIQTQIEITNDESQILDSIKGLKDVQDTPYLPVSLISNSRSSHQVLIQKILESQREIVTSYFEEKTKKIYEGDLIGFLERKRINLIDQRIVILTTPGLDDTPSQQKFEAEINSFQKLKMNIKDFNKKHGDKKGYSKQLSRFQKEESCQLMTIFQLMKKTIICFYLICQSNTIFVVLQDNQQDFALYQQIKLICSNFLGDENQQKEINFIHFCSQIPDVKSENAEFQFQKIKAKFNLKDSASDFKNECFMKFEEKEDHDSYYRNKLGKQIQFYHLMLFGSFESRYNEQLFEQIKKDIESTKCDKVVPKLIENQFKKKAFEILTHFFEVSKEQEQDQQENQAFQFKERQINLNQQHDQIDDDDDDDDDDEDLVQDNYLEWKDLVFYPYSFLTPNQICQQQSY